MQQAIVLASELKTDWKRWSVASGVKPVEVQPEAVAAPGEASPLPGSVPLLTTRSNKTMQSTTCTRH